MSKAEWDQMVAGADEPTKEVMSKVGNSTARKRAKILAKYNSSNKKGRDKLELTVQIIGLYMTFVEKD